jgi:alkylation response protein AidB-like acyl-CoA dehydrogenase
MYLWTYELTFIFPLYMTWTSAFKRASEVGIIPTVVGWPEEHYGKRPEGFDAFFLVVAFDELCRCASGGVVWGLVGGLGIGLPPIVYYGTEEMQKRVTVPCLKGKSLLFKGVLLFLQDLVARRFKKSQ